MSLGLKKKNIKRRFIKEETNLIRSVLLDKIRYYNLNIYISSNHHM